MTISCQLCSGVHGMKIALNMRVIIYRRSTENALKIYFLDMNILFQAKPCSTKWFL